LGLKTTATIVFTLFYLLGTLTLPFADFSVIKDLPEMFRHCKATEDHDLNIFEFFTEHVSGLGQLVEGTEHEDEEEEDGDKPHAPLQFHFEQQQIICINHYVKMPVVKPAPEIKSRVVLVNGVYISTYIANIFRPPIA
jgi:hypothetical protein